MANKSLPNKPYSFHFTNNISKNTTPTPTSTPLSEHQNQIKNLNLNFRYQPEQDYAKEAQKKKNYVAKFEVPRAHGGLERTSLPIKRYTFSILAKERDLRKSDDIEVSKRGTIDQQSEYFQNNNLENKQQTELRQDNDPIKQDKKQMLDNQDLALKNAGQVTILRDQKLKLEQRLAERQKQNAVLRQKIQLFNQIISQKDLSIRCYQKEIQSMKSKANKDKNQFSTEKKQSIGLQSQLAITSNIYSYQFDELSFQKENKQWSSSTLASTFEEQYKQILSMFSIDISEENALQKVVSEIERGKYKVEELTQKLQRLKEKEKESCRLTQIIPKLERQIIALSHMNQIISAELRKYDLMLSHSNTQIQKLHLHTLNEKYRIIHK